MSAGKTVSRLAGLAALLALLVASKQPQEREWPLSPEDKKWDMSFRPVDVTDEIRTKVRKRIADDWNVKKDPTAGARRVSIRRLN